MEIPRSGISIYVEICLITPISSYMEICMNRYRSFHLHGNINFTFPWTWKSDESLGVPATWESARLDMQIPSYMEMLSSGISIYVEIGRTTRISSYLETSWTTYADFHLHGKNNFWILYLRGILPNHPKKSSYMEFWFVRYADSHLDGNTKVWNFHLRGNLSDHPNFQLHGNLYE